MILLHKSVTSPRSRTIRFPLAGLCYHFRHLYLLFVYVSHNSNAEMLSSIWDHSEGWSMEGNQVITVNISAFASGHMWVLSLWSPWCMSSVSPIGNQEVEAHCHFDFKIPGSRTVWSSFFMILVPQFMIIYVSSVLHSNQTVVFYQVCSLPEIS